MKFWTGLALIFIGFFAFVYIDLFMLINALYGILHGANLFVAVLEIILREVVGFVIGGFIALSGFLLIYKSK